MAGRFRLPSLKNMPLLIDATAFNPENRREIFAKVEACLLKDCSVGAIHCIKLTDDTELLVSGIMDDTVYLTHPYATEEEMLSIGYHLDRTG